MDQMPLRVDLTTDWQDEPRSRLIDESELAELLVYALNRENQIGAWELAIRFVDDDEMMAAHELFLGDSSATDIMTFPYDDEAVRGGDILISVDTAEGNATEHGWAVSDELRFLTLHGLLHILGWDDTDDAERSRMLDRQREILEAWREAGCA